MTRITEGEDAIGGYLELERGPASDFPYPGAIGYQAARSAFLALLLASRPARVWLPWYICHTMVEQARIAGVDVARYGLNERLGIEEGVELASGDLVLYVNYFGMCDAEVDTLGPRFGAGRVIIDNSHAFFSKPGAHLATIYSPRKFVGVPDGGLLVTDTDIAAPEAQDEGSVWRCIPLLTRLSDRAESGYAQFLQGERGLGNQMPVRMSRLTRRLLEAIDWPWVARQRNANFRLLDAGLSGSNRFPLRLREGQVPLCYPFIGTDRSARRRLIDNRIYVPTFWPDLTGVESGAPEFERYLAADCIPLPCDQRYGRAHMTRISTHLGAAAT